MYKYSVNTMADSGTIICTPCLRVDHQVNAVKYCVDCNENFCKPCLKQHIKTYVNQSQAHRLINRDEMPEWISLGLHQINTTTGRVAPTCHRHQENPLDSFCKSHNIVCCGACTVIEHSTCEEVLEIDEAIQEFDKLNLSAGLARNIDFTIAELQQTISARTKDRSLIKKNTAEALLNIREYRKRINAIFDELERKTVEKIDTIFIEEDNSVEHDLERLNKMKVFLELCKGHIIRKSVDSTAVEYVINICNANNLVKRGNELCFKCMSKIGRKTNMFKMNQDIENYISNIEFLGEFSDLKRHSIKIHHVKDVSASVKTDNDTCDLQGSTITNSGIIILADAGNRNIKILDESYAVHKVFQLTEYTNVANQIKSYEPVAVCSLSGSDIAIAMGRDKEVWIIDIDGEIKLESKIIGVREYCRGIAYSNALGELYVACGGGSYAGEGLGHIRVYNLAGELLRSLKKNSSGKQLVHRPMHLATSSDGTKLHISDMHKGVVTIDKDGNVLRTILYPDLEEARGLGVDSYDHVLVCGCLSNNVIQIDNHSTSYEILNESDGIVHPQTVCFDTKRSRIIVTNNCSNCIKVFEVK